MPLTNANLRNQRLFYMNAHPELFTVDLIRERNPVLVASLLGKDAINDPFSPDMNLADRMIYNLNHKARHELVESVFGEEEEEEDFVQAVEAETEAVELERELVKMSQELFLAGKMDGFDYDLVERFEKDTVSREENQDLEDAYFNQEDEDSEDENAFPIR
jgi:hypothetical protein